MNEKINEINISIDFASRNCYVNAVMLTTMDYNSTKMIFDFNGRDEGIKVFEMISPSGKLVFLEEIVDNQLILGGQTEDGEPASIFTEAGSYTFEVSLYNGDSKLTSAPGSLEVTKEQIVIDGEVVDQYLPAFDKLMKDVTNALLTMEKDTNAIEKMNIVFNKTGNKATITITDFEGKQKNLYIYDGDPGVKGEKGDTGAAGASISKIEKTDTDGLIDTYTIYLTNGSTHIFQVKNGTEESDINKDYVDIADNKAQQQLNNMLEILDYLIPHKILEGYPIIIQDSVPMKPKSLTIRGNVDQETRTGKNLFTFVAQSNNEFYTTFEDDTMTVTCKRDGTGNGIFIKIPIDDDLLVHGQTYKIVSEDVSGVKTSLMLQLRQKDGGSSTNSWNNKVTYNEEYSLYVVGNVMTEVNTEQVVAGQQSIIKNIQVLKDSDPEEPYESFGKAPFPEYPTEMKNIQGVENLLDYSNIGFASGTLDYTIKDDIISMHTKSEDTYPRIRFNIFPLIKNNPGKTLAFNCDYLEYTGNGIPVQGDLTIDGKTQYIKFIDEYGIMNHYKIPKDNSVITAANLCLYANNNSVAKISSLMIKKPILYFVEDNIDGNYVPDNKNEYIPIKITGRNIFNINSLIHFRTKKYIEFEMNNDTIYMKSLYPNTNNYIWCNIPVSVGKKMTISYEELIENEENPNNRLSYMFSDNKILEYSSDIHPNASYVPKTDKYVTVTAEKKYLVLIVRLGSQPSEYTIKGIQVEYDDKPNKHESYKERNYYIPMRKREILKRDEIEFYSNNSGSFEYNRDTIAQRMRTNTFNIKDLGMKANTYYTVVNIPNGWTLQTVQLYTEYNGEKINTSENYDKTNNTFILRNEDIKYINIVFINENATEYANELFRNSNIQIYEGTSDEPYHSISKIGKASVKDYNIIVKDELDIINGKLIKRVAGYTFKGYESFSDDISNRGRVQVSGPNIVDGQSRFYCRSNYFEYYESGGNNTPGLCFTANHSFYLYLPEKYDTLEKYKDFFTDKYNEGDPVIMEYEAREPQEIDIPALKDIKLFPGYNHITIGDKYGLVDDMEIEYYQDWRSIAQLKDPEEEAAVLLPKGDSLGAVVPPSNKDIVDNISDMMLNKDLEIKVDMNLSQDDLASKINAASIK